MTWVERWNGSGWTIQRTVSGSIAGGLGGVSCASATFCVAVGWSPARSGSSVALIETWNGGDWTVQRAPTPAGAAASRFAAVSCASPIACIALGSFSPTTSGASGRSFVDVWNGSTWAVQHVSAPAGESIVSLISVSCASAIICAAVGDEETGEVPGTVVARWDGSTWTVQNAPSELDDVTGVSCPSATACIISTAGPGILEDELNGSTWNVTVGEHSNSVFGLSGVSCAAATACTAIGQANRDTVALRWDGSRSSTENIPNRLLHLGAGDNQVVLHGVSCATATACVVVGEAEVGDQTGSERLIPLVVSRS
jgi:hypothetical protein